MVMEPSQMHSNNLANAMGAMIELQRAAKVYARHPTNKDLWHRLYEASIRFAEVFGQKSVQKETK